MRKISITNLVLAGAVVASFALLGVVVFGNGSSRKRVKADDPHAIRISTRSDKPKQATSERIRVQPNGRGVLSRDEKLAADKTKLKTLAEKEEDALLDGVIKELVSALDNASSKRDYRAIFSLVDKLRALQYGAKLAKDGRSWHGGSSIKSKILSSLIDAGPAVEALDAIVDLVGDEDPVIAQSATDLLFKSLEDLSLGDYKRADIVTAAAEEMTDTLSLIRLYQEFIKMRPSVGGNALLQIADSGTAEAKAMLAHEMVGFTSDEMVTTPERLKEWLSLVSDPDDTTPYEPIQVENDGREAH